MIGIRKIVYLTLLASYVNGTLQENIPKCPEVNSIDHTLHLPHATNCTLFYRCDHGIAKLENCPGGLHFNLQLQVCDWPVNANCLAEATTTAIPTTSSTSQTTSVGVTEDTSDGTTDLENISTTESDGSNSSIDTTYSYVSTTTAIPSTCPVDVITTDTIIRIPHETNCRYYYICQSGKATLYQCKSGQHFSPAVKYCKPEAQAGCRMSSTTSTTTYVTTSEITSDANIDETTDEVWVTTDLPESSIEVTSDADTTLSSTETTNESTVEVTTSDDIDETTEDITSSTDNSSVVTPRPSACPLVDEPGVVIRLPHETNCRYYYICKSGTPSLYQCKSGQHFSVSSNYCRAESEAGCALFSSTDIPTTRPTTITTPEEITVEETTDESAGTSIDESNEATDNTGGSSENTDVTDESSTESSNTSDSEETTDDSITYECPSVDEPGVVVRLPHEFNCRYYYICNNGSRSLFQCYGGQHFSATLRICTTEDEAGCSMVSSTATPSTKPTEGSTEEVTQDLNETTMDGSSEESNEATTENITEDVTDNELNESTTLELNEPTSVASETSEDLLEVTTETEGNDVTDSNISSSSGTTTTESNIDTTNTVNESSSTSTVTTTVSSVAQCPDVDEPGVVIRLPHATVCVYYYICTNGSRGLYQCYPGQHFSPTSLICLPEDEAGCGVATSSFPPSMVPIDDTSISETTEYSTTEQISTVAEIRETTEDLITFEEVDTTSSPPKCPLIDEPDVPVRLPHETNCTWYYMCKNGKTSLFQCYRGEHFSPRLLVCMPENEAGCV